MKYINRTINKKLLQKLIAWSYSNYGSARTAQMADKLKSLGFRFATKGGVSISVDDLQVPPSKKELLEQAEEEIRGAEQRYVRGEITEVERFQKVIDTWNSTSEALKDQVVKNFEATDRLNSVYMMAFSGARGNISQVRQLVGMRGLMADPQGEIIDLPIKTNFREGLTVTEYIISSYGARKGLVDTALRTADSGYLTRRLVDVSQDVIVRELDCGTTRGIVARPMTDSLSGKILIPLSDRLLGRTAGVDVYHPKTGELLAHRNQEISEPLAKKIQDSGVPELLVRSPLTCEANRSVCQTCYGWSLAHGKTVDLGEAIGIIAAQSIGEPGTQLTMRTFHTGGIFTGEVAEQFLAKIEGKVQWDANKLRVRAFRTRHGEDAFIAESNGNMEIVGVSESETPQKLPILQGSVIFVNNGEQVSIGQLIAEVPVAGRTTRKTTEKAVKDVTCDLAGEVKFDALPSEEKTDRQGNITRTATRGGLIWVLAGEVYNLPPGAEPIVKNGDRITVDQPIAAARTTTEHGGVVRIRQEGEDGNPREIEIITASVILDRAIVRLESSQGREQYIIYAPGGQRFALKVTPGSKVDDREVLAELLDDRYRTQTGGLIRYAGVEVQKRGKAKQGYEVIKGGTILWIPEECHEVNKDISLLMVEEGQYVEGGTEIVKDIFCQTSGIVEITQKNDILREITIKPGEIHLIDNPEGWGEGTIFYPGQEIIPDLIAEELQYVEGVETPEGPAIILRPVQEFPVLDHSPVPSQESINQTTIPEIKSTLTEIPTTSGAAIALRAVQRLPYKDGERVKSVEGVELLRTQLVPEIVRNAAQLAADIELIPDEQDPTAFRLQLVILESLVIRRDVTADPTQGKTQTKLLVQDNDTIEPGATVARTEILSKEAGEVHGIVSGTEVVRRLLLVRKQDLVELEVAGPVTAKRGQLLIAGTEIAEGLALPESCQIVDVSKPKEDTGHTKLTIRLARPYRVSPGAVLHINDGDLVQRGDNLVLLVFERAKTGDIIQGLPRIEELLEARRPKEGCMMARRPGTAQITSRDDESVEIRILEADGTIAEYPLTVGRSCLISDGETVQTGEALTDGPSNPHEILEVFFNYYRESESDYQAALKSFQACQTFLVNEVQSVYQSQGIEISDKHVEVIVRQMTSKVRIEDGGDYTYLPGELIELREVEKVNETLSITGGAPVQYTPMLLGITKASLNTDSFISAASFQETTRVLTEAAIEGKSDWLRGLKENVIIGRLIPAGTGFSAYEEMFSGEGGYDRGYEEEEADYASDVVLDDLTSARGYGSFNSFSDSYEDPEDSDEGDDGVLEPVSEDEALVDEVEDEVDEADDEVEEDDYEISEDDYS